jgi:hypothetical protein
MNAQPCAQAIHFNGLDPHHEAKAAFADHWAGVYERTQAGRTNHEVRIWEPGRETGAPRTKARSGAKAPKTAKRPAVTIRVIRAY